MAIDVPSFDSLAHPDPASVPEGYALYQKDKARRYIRERNEFIAHVSRTLARTDLTDTMKITVINMHPGRNLK